MKLTKIESILKQKISNKEFDSCGIFVYKDREECFLHSNNVNRDMLFDIASMGKILMTTTLILKAIDEKTCV